MKRLYLPLILFLLLVLEGVALELLPTVFFMSKSFIIPHWIFIFLLLITVFYDKENTYYSIIYALFFGLLIDVVYTGVLGVYMFSYAAIIYLIHILRRTLHTNFYITMILAIVGIALVDSSINIIYTILGFADMFWKDYLLYRLLPTVLANFLFLLILYPLIQQRLIKWGNEQLFGNNSF